jgi:acetyl-CoA carboxylase biotin carboxyl carrier protein
VTNVVAHVTGTVSRIVKSAGDAVAPGDELIVLESMKMEMPIEATSPGKVKEVRCREGQAISEGDVLMVLGN